MMRLKKANLENFLEAIAYDMDLYTPIKKDNITTFKIYNRELELDFDTLKVNVPPKNFFLPQVEGLYETKTKKGEITIHNVEDDQKSFVIFGARVCDIAGIDILDSVYLNTEPIDQFYKTKRDASLIIALGCNEPLNTCFCGVFNIDPSASTTADINMIFVEDYLYLEANSGKGEDFISKYENKLEKTSEDILAQKDEIGQKLAAKPFNKLNLTNFDSKKLLQLFDSKIWEDVYKPCIGCGTCTFVCPTCQCYDIKDYSHGSNVLRYRCHDSCMYSDFTMMAHGNIRHSQKERFRQRFMHKLVYHPDNHDGVFGCVGCGRCINKCPVSINIVKVATLLQKEADSFV